MKKTKNKKQKEKTQQLFLACPAEKKTTARKKIYRLNNYFTSLADKK